MLKAFNALFWVIVLNSRENCGKHKVIKMKGKICFNLLGLALKFVVHSNIIKLYRKQNLFLIKPTNHLDAGFHRVNQLLVIELLIY